MTAGEDNMHKSRSAKCNQNGELGWEEQHAHTHSTYRQHSRGPQLCELEPLRRRDLLHHAAIVLVHFGETSGVGHGRVGAQIVRIRLVLFSWVQVGTCGLVDLAHTQTNLGA